MFTLNRVGVRILELLQEGQTMPSVVSQISGEFGAPAGVATLNSPEGSVISGAAVLTAGTSAVPRIGSKLSAGSDSSSSGCSSTLTVTTAPFTKLNSA